MAKKGSSAGKKGAYARYKTSSTYSKNKVAKIKRHLKNHPNDLQAASGLENTQYSRKKPKSKMWTSSRKEAAQLMKSFTGRKFVNDMLSSEYAAHKKAFETNEKTTRTKNTHILTTLGDRAHYRFAE